MEARGGGGGGGVEAHEKWESEGGGSDEAGHPQHFIGSRKYRTTILRKVILAARRGRVSELAVKSAKTTCTYGLLLCVRHASSVHPEMDTPSTSQQC